LKLFEIALAKNTKFNICDFKIQFFIIRKHALNYYVYYYIVFHNNLQSENKRSKVINKKLKL